MPDTDDALAIPAPALPAVTPRLGCCARHGLPPLKRVDFALQSRPTLESSRTLSGSVVTITRRLTEHAEKVKVTSVTGWPLCARCTRTRRWWLAVAAVFFWGGLGLLVGAIVARVAAGSPSATLAIPMLTGIVLVIAAPAPFVVSSIPRIINARTSDDGSAVVVRDPHPRFADQARAALTGGPSAPA